MRKTISVVLTLCMVFSMIMFVPGIDMKADAAAYNINGGTQTSATFIIDPGHMGASGGDPGACALGRQEADDVLDMSLKVGRYIINSGASVSFTRVTSMAQSLSAKCAQANNGSFSYFVSVHRNAGGGTGMETFYYTGSTASYNLAEAINSRVVNATGWRNRGLKSGNHLAVVNGTNMPACLLELGFIDTAADNTVFVNYNDAIARAIAEGMLSMIGKSLVVPSTLTDKLNGNSPVTPLASDIYVKISSQATNVSTGTFLTRNSDNTVTAATETASNNQVWKLKKNSDSTYTFYNAGNGYCLDANGAASDDGTAIQAYTPNSSNAQKFYLYDFNGGYLLRACYAQNAVVDVSTTYGTVQLWTGHYGENQRYNIQRVDVNGTLPTSVGESFAAKIKLSYSGRYVTYNGDNVEMADTGCDWQFTRNTNGTYSLVAIGDGRSLDVNGATFANSTNLQLWTANDSKAQQFYIYNIGGLYYFKPNGGEQFVIDIDAASQNAQIYSFSTSEASLNAQRFQFVVDRPTDSDYLPVDAVNGNQDAVTGQVWTTGTFTGTSCGTIVIQVSNGTYVVKEKYTAGQARSIAASASNLVISVHSSMAAYSSLCDLEVGDVVSIGGIQPWQSVAFVNAYVKLPVKFELRDPSPYTMNGLGTVRLSGIGASASQIASEFKCSVGVYTAKGVQMGDTEVPGTGCMVRRVNSTGVVTDEAVIVVGGDVNGDGQVSAADYMAMRTSITGVSGEFKGAFAEASDMNGDGQFSASDYTAVMLRANGSN